MISLAENNYGKQGIRLVKVERGAERHELRDLTVGIRFEGDFATAHSEGDNHLVLPTDTMKNTVYALAARGSLGEIEEFGLALGRQFLAGNSQVWRVQVAIGEHLWDRVEANGAPHPHAFVRAGAETRRATVGLDRERSAAKSPGGAPGEAPNEVKIEAGLEGLVLLKTAGSSFAGFPRDALTTLRETSDRVLATAVDASWLYDLDDLDDLSGGNGIDFGSCWRGVRDLLVAAFAGHESRSLQHTLHAMGEAVLASRPEIDSIHLSLPNRHHLPIDLSPFGLENRNEVFVATTEPYGLIEATLTRG